MSAIRQIVLSLVVLAGALYLWIAYVPAAMPLLERAGILDLLGIDPAEAAQAPEGQQRRGGGGAVKVIVGEVAERKRDDIVTAIGDGRAQRAVTVRSEAVGRLTEINMHSGLRVEAGDVLARLEDEAQTIALERARIMLADAQADAERVQRLETTGAVTEVRRSEAELALRTAELAQREAEFELERRRIVAPIDGWVGIIDFEVGDRIDAQAALATITDRSQILIDFRVPERVIGDIEIGTHIEVTPLGLRNVTLQGEISAIDTTVDRASRTLRVQGRVDNVSDRLRVGMAFSVTMNFPGDTLLSIDPLALQWSSDGAFVWAVRDGKAAQVSVEIRQRNADQVLVEGDLEAGERIVTEGVQNLRPGTEVSFDEKAAARLVTRRLQTL